jgi:hypothetical protein
MDMGKTILEVNELTTRFITRFGESVTRLTTFL